MLVHFWTQPIFIKSTAEVHQKHAEWHRSQNWHWRPPDMLYWHATPHTCASFCPFTFAQKCKVIESDTSQSTIFDLCTAYSTHLTEFWPKHIIDTICNDHWCQDSNYLWKKSKSEQVTKVTYRVAKVTYRLSECCNFMSFDIPSDGASETLGVYAFYETYILLYVSHVWSWW